MTSGRSWSQSRQILRKQTTDPPGQVGVVGKSARPKQREDLRNPLKTKTLGVQLQHDPFQSGGIEMAQKIELRSLDVGDQHVDPVLGKEPGRIHRGNRNRLGDAWLVLADA